MGLRKAIDLTIADGDATTAALDLAPYSGLSIKLGAATAMDSATAVTHMIGCDSSAGTYADILSDTTSKVAFGQLKVLDQMRNYPKYLKISSDSTVTAAAGLSVTAYVNII